MRKELAEYIKQFENTLNFSDISWWIIDYKNDSGYFYCNDLMCEYFDLDKSVEKHSVNETCPIAGDYIKNVKLASTKQANLIIKEYLELLNQEKKEYNNSFPYFDKRIDKIKYFSSRAKALELDKDGNVSILFGIIEEITNKVSQSKEIEEYNEIIDKNVITSTTDKNGYILTISEAFCKISGYTKEELIGKTHHMLKHPTAKNIIYKNMWVALNKGEVWEGEFKNITKDGKSFWVKAVISPSLDDEGNIKGYTTVNQDITDKKIIEKLSNRDKLTNLYNRGKLDSILSREINRFKRYKTEFSIIILDIDHFKNINDTYGHLVGDEVLIQFANILNKHTRNTDYVGRWGGEEFLIICSNCDIKQAKQIANKLRKQIEEATLNIDSKITASFGVTQIKDNDSSDDIIQRADDALYKCKDSGRNTVEIL